MKILRNLIHLNLIIFLLTACVACTKEKSEKTAQVQAAGSYTFAGRTIASKSGDYYVDANKKLLYANIHGEGATDVIQIIFLGRASMPAGTYKFSPQANDPDTQFAGGFISSADHPDAPHISGGTIVVTKDGDMVNISFDCSTDAGNFKGNYKGVFTQRQKL